MASTRKPRVPLQEQIRLSGYGIFLPALSAEHVTNLWQPIPDHKFPIVLSTAAHLINTTTRLTHLDLPTMSQEYVIDT